MYAGEFTCNTHHFSTLLRISPPSTFPFFVFFFLNFQSPPFFREMHFMFTVLTLYLSTKMNNFLDKPDTNLLCYLQTTH